ncbi:bifunctional 5,10-methylene-tetrahydrofolate dehydrogenase/5,10-methylene-tetrahydrofolate cyclohydrolase [Caminicella sporogenes]|nr:bifunctional 5,10-methylenetetrahydrofolate dehydrogenase/5,10-methenyltetrahydrofolate cyclohydrolase [Caminicella sporogenes]RKD28064.1 bifunctional 5,10-methylene-tetrahydrofolate dehydrogenase/5,10-methylene-tetrahydrofolate cyclohydrolase [Caminicella sporogenes]
MVSNIINGREISKKRLIEIEEKVKYLSDKYGKVPGLAVVYIGNDKASEVYVNTIIKKCTKVHFYSEKHLLSENVSEDEILDLINNLNKNEKINGIIIQFPLPKGIDENKIKFALSYEKDVDCINPINVGMLYSNSKSFLPCTPKGVIELIKSINQDLTGKNAVVVGRSNIVGKPVAELLQQENLTVTLCHSKTKDLKEHLLRADVVVAAAGRANLIKGDMLKENCIVIDVGTNVVDGKLVGDVEFDSAVKKASYITPVPGGVGPMTIAMLLENTLEACLKQCELKF